MKAYKEMSREELLALKDELEQQYKAFQDKGLSLDMSRGKPSAAQLDLSMGMMDVLDCFTDLRCEVGIDCRNYGVMDGVPEAKRLLGELIEVPADNIIIYFSQYTDKFTFVCRKKLFLITFQTKQFYFRITVFLPYHITAVPEERHRLSHRIV